MIKGLESILVMILSILLFFISLFISFKKVAVMKNIVFGFISIEYTDIIKAENAEFEKTMAIKTETISKLEQELSLLHHAASFKLQKKV